MILDATAGNRVIWNVKDLDSVIYVDIERQIERKPTLFADNTKLPFRDKTFDTVFFDPPYGWNFKSMFYSFPNEHLQKAQYATLTRNGTPSYYGMERYKTREALISYIYRAQKELCRVLKDDGLLWFKWNELRFPLPRVQIVLDRWEEVLRFELKSRKQQLGREQTFWLCLTKLQNTPTVKTLEEYVMPMEVLA